MYGPIYELEKLEQKDKQDKDDKEDEEEPIGVSPCGRFDTHFALIWLMTGFFRVI